MKMWIARDKDTNELWGYTHRPVLDVGMYRMDFSCKNTSSYELPEEWFPEVTYDNSPQQVEIKLIENE